MPPKQILRNFLLAILLSQLLILLLMEIYGIFVIHEGSFILYFISEELSIKSFTFIPWFGLSVIIGHLFGYSFPQPNELRVWLLPLILWSVVTVIVYCVVSLISLRKGDTK